MFRSGASGAAIAVLALFLSSALPALAQQQPAPDQPPSTTAKPEFNVPTVLPPVEVNQERSSGPRRAAGGPRDGQGGVVSAGAGQSQDGPASGGVTDPSAGITAGRDARTVERTTNVTVISAKQIEDAQARTLDEALRLAPGVYVRDGGGEGVPRIDIRGFRTRNITLLIDGIPFNSAFDGQFDPRMIPVNNIARIKITEGSSSVLYGPNGNAAVIEIITKKAEAGLHGSAEAEISPQNNSIREQNTLSYGGEKVSSFASFSGLTQDHWNLSDSFQPDPNNAQKSGQRLNSDRKDAFAYGNMEYDPSVLTKFGASVSYSTGDYGKPPNTSSDPVFGKTVQWGRVDNYEGWNLQSSLQQKFGDDVTWRPIAFFNQLSQLTNRYDDSSFTTQNKAGSFSEDALTTIYGGGQQLSWRWGSGQLLTLSANAENDTWHATGFSIVNQGTKNKPKLVSVPELEDHSLQTYWVAAEQELRFTPQWTGVAGAGYAENIRENADNSGYNYLVGTRYELTDDTALKGTVSHKIRFPTLGDLYKVQSGNPDLKPETTQNYEVAVEQNLPRLSMFMTLALFRTEAQNFIEVENSLAIPMSENIDRYNFQGVEVRGRYTGIRNLDANFGYTYLDSENISAGATTQVLQARPRHRVTAALTYLFSTGTKVNLDYMFVGSNEDLSNGQNNIPIKPIGLPDYHLLSAGITQEINDHAEVFVRAQNLLDQNYEDNFGFQQAGRTFYFGARAKF